MRLVLALLLTIGFAWAQDKPNLDVPKDPPKLTAEQKLEIRELQIQILNLNLQLERTLLYRKIQELNAKFAEKLKGLTPEGYSLNNALDLAPKPKEKQ